MPGILGGEIEGWTMVKGLINKVLLQSLVDGPGNRAVVFFQGCNLNCVYCHNPSTLGSCTGCGDCVPSCPSGALTMGQAGVRWDARMCVDCEACIRACPHFSTPRVWEATPEELWKAIQPRAMYLAGVTASGGEATLQTDFVTAFFGLVKQEARLTTMIETNGCLTTDALSQLLPVLDSAIVDLKAFDDGAHRRLTGAGNELTMASIWELARVGKLDSVRVTVVPGWSDSVENAEKTARFLLSLDPEIPIRFQRFRPHGTRGEATAWASPSDETMDTLCAVAREAGLLHVSRSM